MIYLMLLLMVLGTASTSAQVRIGGTENPATGAVLDLNKDDGTNDKGLLLPKVALQSGTDNTTAGPHTSGMVVYNTANVGDVTPGFYYNNGSAWVRVGNGTSIAADAIDSTKIKNGTVGLEDIRDNIISSEKIMDGTIESADLSSMGAVSGDALVWDGTRWSPRFVATILHGTVQISYAENAVSGSAKPAWVSECSDVPANQGVPTNNNGAYATTCSVNSSNVRCTRVAHTLRAQTFTMELWCFGK